MDGRAVVGDDVRARTGSAREPVFYDAAGHTDDSPGHPELVVQPGISTGSPTPVSFVHHFIDLMGVSGAGRVDAAVGEAVVSDGVDVHRSPDVDLGAGSSNTDVVLRVPRKIKTVVAIVVLGLVYGVIEIMKMVR